MNFLIHSGAGIGSVVQQTAFAAAIKKQYPGARIDLLVAGNESKQKLDVQILECQHAISSMYYYSLREPIHDAVLIPMLRANNYDIGITTVESAASRRTIWPYRIMKAAGCRSIIGSGFAGLDVNIHVPSRTHYAKRQDLYLEALGISPISDYSVIDKALLPMDWVQSLGLTVGVATVAIVPGTKPIATKKHNRGDTYDVKSWGLENGAALAEKLIAAGFNVSFIGGKAEKEEIAASNVEMPSSVLFHDFAGKTSVKQSLALLRASDLVIGSEGGMVHCAAAVGVNTLTVFGGTDYMTLRPIGDGENEFISSNLECYPCFGTPAAAACRRHRCLESATVNLVYNKAIAMLKGKG